jgi:hypothetical protein
VIEEKLDSPVAASLRHNRCIMALRLDIQSVRLNKDFYLSIKTL